MEITSSVFENHGKIPKKYTCQGDDINPPLMIRNIPEGTVSLALVLDDPDAPGQTWDHWVMWNIKPVEVITENSVPGKQGKNSWGNNNYGGPCPPSGTHRYFFKLYALACELALPEGAIKSELEAAMANHILETSELIGLYQK